MPSAPSLPFTIIENAFQGLHRPPDPLHIACGSISGSLPQCCLPPHELRVLLLHPSTTYEIRDAVLGWLVGRAQKDGGRWIVAVAGMVLPGLRARTATLRPTRSLCSRSLPC